MNKQQIELAVGTGLELFGDKSELPIPARMNDGVFLLKQLLLMIGNGQISLQSTAPEVEPVLEPKKSAAKK